MSKPSPRRAGPVATAALLTLCALTLGLHPGCGTDGGDRGEPTSSERLVRAVDEIADPGQPPPQPPVASFRADARPAEDKDANKEVSGLYALRGPADAAVPAVEAGAPSPLAAPAERVAHQFAAKAKKGNGTGGLARNNRHRSQPLGGAFAVGAEQDVRWSGEGYDRIEENTLTSVLDDPRSTFSIDVDTASYANVRRLLRQGTLPPPGAVRVEEMINYFDYAYAPPAGDAPFSVTAEVGPCPWNSERQLVHIGLQGKVIAPDEVPARNLVFLLDVSGSMNDTNKLPLVKRALGFLAEDLTDEDRVSIVVYAGASGLVLPPTSGANTRYILGALDRLEAGGSTNGGEGIELAYRVAQENFIDDGVNRVILATDGDFNVGATSRSDLIRLIERKRQDGTFLSVLGFGMGNLKDSSMEQLADKGNGNYAYIDTETEARKVLVEEASATLVTIAKDVKIQTEFNPAQVASYRLVGYENRALAHRDFNDDTKDAGEIGAGHTVTALYEIVPASAGVDQGVDPLRYQTAGLPSVATASGELMTVKIRYKDPDADTSEKLELPIALQAVPLEHTSDDYRFSAAVAEMGMLLRGRDLADASYAEVADLARGARGTDSHCYRAEFLTLVRQAAQLAGEPIDGDTAIACTPSSPRTGDRLNVSDPRAAFDLGLRPAATMWSVLGGLYGFLRGLPTVIQWVPGLLALPLLLLAARWGRRRR